DASISTSPMGPGEAMAKTSVSEKGPIMTGVSNNSAPEGRNHPMCIATPGSEALHVIVNVAVVELVTELLTSMLPLASLVVGVTYPSMLCQSHSSPPAASIWLCTRQV